MTAFETLLTQPLHVMPMTVYVAVLLLMLMPPQFEPRPATSQGR
jgi:hypothetical protein